MLVKIASCDLRPGMYVASVEGAWLHNPFWRNSFKLSNRKQIDRLVESGVSFVTIDLDKGLGPVAPVRPHSPLSPAQSRSPALAPPRERRAKPRIVRTEMDRARAIVERSRTAVTQMFADARLGRAVTVEDALPIIDEIAQSVQRDASAMLKVTRLKSRNEYTYMHSVAVCALMMNFARHLSLPEHEVRDVGLAGLFHDIGKMATPLEVLDKHGPLTDAELIQIRNHPIEGHRLICDSPSISTAALDVCMHHHERMDGKGYPFGLTGDQLSLHARMGAICDVYDAITSHRPYKDPWPPNEALARMQLWEGHFDPGLLEIFIASIGIPPLGALVRLRSNRLAIVTRLREGADPCKPDARSFYDVETASALPVEDVRTDEPGNDIIRAERSDYWFGAEWPRMLAHLQAGKVLA